MLTQTDIQRLRQQTKGTAHCIHFNNAGASLPPGIVVETVTSYLQYEAITGGYEAEANYKTQLDNVYTLIAKLINADASEIALTESASAGWWIAFNGMGLQPGDVVLTCELEYVTNILGLLHAKNHLGVEVKVIPNNGDGSFNLQALEEAITPRVKLIAATHIGSTAGNVLPVEAIGTIAKKQNILYLLDACQSIGQAPVNVQSIQCDMLAVTGRKYLRAPRGTGFLYVRKEIQDRLKLTYMDGFSAPHVTNAGHTTRTDARRFELYERNRALTLGLGKAVEYALAIGIENIWQRVQTLAGILRNSLAQIDGITVHDIGDVKCGIVTFSAAGHNGYAVRNMLAEKHINVSVGKAHSTLFYMEKHGLDRIVRASVHYYNTQEETEIFSAALKAILASH